MSQKWSLRNTNVGHLIKERKFVLWESVLDAMTFLSDPIQNISCNHVDDDCQTFLAYSVSAMMSFFCNALNPSSQCQIFCSSLQFGSDFRVLVMELGSWKAVMILVRERKGSQALCQVVLLEIKSIPVKYAGAVATLIQAQHFGRYITPMKANRQLLLTYKDWSWSYFQPTQLPATWKYINRNPMWATVVTQVNWFRCNEELLEEAMIATGEVGWYVLSRRTCAW